MAMFIAVPIWFYRSMSKAKSSKTKQLKKLKKLKRLKKRNAELDHQLTREIARRKKWKARAKELEAQLKAHLKATKTPETPEPSLTVVADAAEAPDADGAIEEAVLAAEPDETWTVEELRSLAQRRNVEGYEAMDKETLLITLL